MNSPSSAASQRYSGQCSFNARHIITPREVVAGGEDAGLSALLGDRGHRPRLQTSASRSNALDIQSHSIQSAARAEVERFPIGVAPGKIMRVLWRNDRPEMFALR